MRRLVPLTLSVLASCSLPQSQFAEEPFVSSAPLTRPMEPRPLAPHVPEPARRPESDAPQPMLLAALAGLPPGEGTFVTRGTILGDRTMLGGRRDTFPDFVLSERGASVRLTNLAWPQPLYGAEVLAYGTIERGARKNTLRVDRLEPYRAPRVTRFVIDDRPQEQGERLGVLPSLHSLRAEAEHTNKVEFFFDPDNGPLQPIGADDTPGDGFRAEWHPFPGDIGTVRAMTTTIFGESTEGAALQVRVGDVPFGW